MISLAFLFLGVALAIAGGELFLKAVLGISAWLRIPPAVTAATLAAFATSSPEIAVAVNAGMEGHGDLAVGDALGSNIVNVGLILGIVLCLGPLSFDWLTHRREFLWALAAPCLVFFVLWDNSFSRWDAGFFILLFLGWLWRVLLSALKNRDKTQDLSPSNKRPWLYVALAVVGLVLLGLAGRFIVVGGTGIGAALGMSTFLVGVTLVAFGTSAPELATAVISRLRGHHDVGIGTILGSNVFNCLFVIGLTGLIGPFQLPVVSIVPSVALGVLALLLLIPLSGSLLSRKRGIGLLGVYLLSILVTLWGRG